MRIQVGFVQCFYRIFLPSLLVPEKEKKIYEKKKDSDMKREKRKQ